MNDTKLQERNPDPGTSLRKLINSEYMLNQMKLALPIHLTPERMARCALTALLKNPTLLKADQSSFTLALLNLAQWGLEPDGRRAHLVPFWNSKGNRYDVVAIPDYKGLAELVLDGGNVSGIHCDVVCDGDDFAYDRGEILRHVVDFRKPRGTPYAAYALITMKEGKPKCEVMARDEIENIRDNSQGYKAFKNGKVNSSIWEDHPLEMWKKTVFKRATKWLKLGSRAQAAVEADDAFEARSQMTVPIDIDPVQHADRAGLIEGPKEPDAPAEEQAQADAGLAPSKPTKEGKLPPQKELQLIVEGAGHTFDRFIRLASEMGWYKDAESYPDWDSLTTDETKRLLRARQGIVKGLELAAIQEGAKQ